MTKKATAAPPEFFFTASGQKYESFYSAAEKYFTGTHV